MKPLRFRAKVLYRGLVTDQYSTDEIEIILELVQKLNRGESIEN